MLSSANSVHPCSVPGPSSHDTLSVPRISGSLRSNSRRQAVPADGDKAGFAETPAGTCGASPVSSTRSEAEWRQALADKDDRFRDLHHRVKNNLQLISSLVSIELRNIKDLEAAQHLRDIQHRMHMLVRVHERLYAAQDVSAARVDAGQELKALCAELGQSSGAVDRNVAIDVESGQIEISTEKLAPLSLIINELVTNAIKHAVQPTPPSLPTKILVSLARHGRDGWASLSVSDSGPGLPVGFDLTGCTGLGMRLIACFVRQLGGTLRIGRVGYDHDALRGACFTISFPVEH